MNYYEYLEEIDQMVQADPGVLHTDTMRGEMKKDFRTFMWFVFKEAYGFTPHRIQLDFAHLMQKGVGTSHILMAMREFGKSIIDAAFIDWFLLVNPNATVLVMSANFDRSQEIVGTALGILKSCDFLTDMCPGKYDLDGRMAFTVGTRTKVVKEPSCTATSITAGNTGKHADLILSDDIEIPKNSDTQPKRQKILEGVDEYTYILNIGGTDMKIGTPQTEDSVYFKLVDDGSHTMSRVPAEYPDVTDEKQMAHLAEFLLEEMRKGDVEQGDPTYPERFGREELAKTKAKAPGTYALQMLLDPSSSDEDKYPLKMRDVIVMELSPDYGPLRVMWNLTNPRDDIESVGLGKDMWYGPGYVDHTPTEYQLSVMGIDPAGNGPDEVGYAVAKNIHSNVFVTAAGGIDGGYDDATLKKLCEIAMTQGVKEIHVEKNFADGMYGVQLARVLGEMGLRIPIVQATAKGQKEQRILATLEPIFASHKLVIDSRVARDQTLAYQITRMRNERGALLHDDRVDALEIALKPFQEMFLIDADKMISNTQDQEFQHEIQGFLQYHKAPEKTHSILGSKRRGTSKPTIFGRQRRRR